jgi:similar to stage IV sporulation protein
VPDLLEEEVPSHVIAAVDGVVTHIEPWNGDAMFREGEAVLKGDILISGEMFMDLHPMVWEGDAGSRLVHAQGKVLARTWRTITASLDLNAPGKAYTGEETHRYAISLLGRRMNFYQNSGIPYDRCDIITRLESWTPLGDRTLPILWEKTTYRAYTLTPVPLDPAKAETMLRTRLMESLEGVMKEGKVLTADYEVSREEDTLTVTLLAQCSEEIGRTVPMDTDQKVQPPKSPLTEAYQEEEKNTKEQSP